MNFMYISKTIVFVDVVLVPLDVPYGINIWYLHMINNTRLTCKAVTLVFYTCMSVAFDQCSFFCMFFVSISLDYVT